MAPIQNSLQTDTPGMGGFVYKDLLNCKEGEFIDYFNGQFYSDYSIDSYNSVIQNNYNPEKIIMGMIFSQDIDKNIEVIKKLGQKYGKQFGGVFLWEYCNAKMDKFENNKDWAVVMKSTMEGLNFAEFINMVNTCTIC